MNGPSIQQLNSVSVLQITGKQLPEWGFSQFEVWNYLLIKNYFNFLPNNTVIYYWLIIVSFSKFQVCTDRIIQSDETVWNVAEHQQNISYRKYQIAQQTQTDEVLTITGILIYIYIMYVKPENDSLAIDGNTQATHMPFFDYI